MPFRFSMICRVYLGACLLLVFGCGYGLPPESNPATARVSLTKALDAWKSGLSEESLKSASPSIVMGDHMWETGYSLESYELTDEEENDGANLHFSVRLVLRDKSGNSVDEQVRYVVSSNPVTIFRE